MEDRAGRGIFAACFSASIKINYGYLLLYPTAWEKSVITVKAAIMLKWQVGRSLRELLTHVTRVKPAMTAL